MLPSDVSIGLQEIVFHFNELEDPRSTINRLHPLPSVLTNVLIGVLAGAKGPTGIAKWAVAKKNCCSRDLICRMGFHRETSFGESYQP